MMLLVPEMREIEVTNFDIQCISFEHPHLIEQFEVKL